MKVLNSLKVCLVWIATLGAFALFMALYFAIEAGYVVGIILSLISIIVLFSLIFFSWRYLTRAEEKVEERRAKEGEEKRKKEAQERGHLLNVTCPAMVQKLQSNGFTALNQVEKKYLFKLSDQMARNLENLHENEVKVLWAAFSNQGVYNMLQMRSSQLQPNNQAALNQLKGIKYASMVSGVNAAREMGESFSE